MSESMSIIQVWDKEREVNVYKVIFVGGGGFCCPANNLGHLSAYGAAAHGGQILAKRAIEEHLAA